MPIRLESPVVRLEAECVLHEIEALAKAARETIAARNDEALTVLALRMAVHARMLTRLMRQLEPRE